jgi:peroxiredoxin Q/BCP
LNALVVGVSADKAVAQRKFVEKFELTFPMVPNPERDIIASYGAETVLGIVAQRSTYLVAPDGRIAHVWPKVSVEGHADDVAATIRRLSGA